MCDLDKDFATLASQDLTLVGSKGVVLSGGQKQRVVSSNCIVSGEPFKLIEFVNVVGFGTSPLFSSAACHLRRSIQRLGQTHCSNCLQSYF